VAVVIELGLTKAQTRLFEDALIEPNQRRRVEIGIHDANEKRIDTLVDPETVVLGGGIQVDTSATVTRSLSLVVTDPRKKLKFDTGSPAKGVVYLDRFISVRHGVFVEALGDWVDVPTFFGPVTGYQQDGPEVTIEAQGKESLMMAPHFVTDGYALKKKELIVDAITRVARRAGERKIDLDEWLKSDRKAKLSKDRAVRPRDEAWKVIAGGSRDTRTGASRGLVGWGDSDRIAFYDGRGRLVARRMSKNPIWTFDDELLSEPTYVFDMLGFRNHVVVKGADPKGKGKTPVTASRSLDPGHPLSPKGMARNGQPRYMTEFIDAPAIKKREDAISRAEEVLARRAFSGFETSFDCLPVPHLEEGDYVRVKSGRTEITFPLLQFSLPLVIGDPMTIGSNRMLNQRSAKRQRKRKTRFRYRG
jgi:hypothetical protein